MSNAIFFGQSFLSYLFVLVVFVVVIALAVTIGIVIAKNIQKKKEANEASVSTDDEYSDTADKDPMQIG